MSVVVQCSSPECGKRYRVQSKAADRAVCPHCGRLLVCPPPEPAPTVSVIRDTQVSPAVEPGHALPSAAAALTAVPAQPVPRSNRTPAEPLPTVTVMNAVDGSVPRRLGRFVIADGKPLGEGAFGTVFRAFDPQLEREVALKVPRAASLESPRARERFLREAKAAARLRHPAIVPVYDAGHDGEYHYLASAFIDGTTLEQAIELRPFKHREVAEIVRRLAEALAYAHDSKIVHRDVKPANVMLDGQGLPHLMDFGLARIDTAEAKLTHDGHLLGTPAYMSPEQASRGADEITGQSDQYSLGVVLYELLTRQQPFAGPASVVLFNVVHQPPLAPRSIDPAIPRDLETICLKAMSKVPADRYASCRDMAEDLRRWLDLEPIRGRPQRLLERAARWSRRQPALAASLVATLLALVTAALLGAAFAIHQARSGAELQQRQQGIEMALLAAQTAQQRAETESRSAQAEQARADRLRKHAEVESARAEAALRENERARQSEKAERTRADAAVAVADEERQRARRRRVQLLMDSADAYGRDDKVNVTLLMLAEALELASQDEDSADLEAPVRLNLGAWRDRIAPGDEPVDPLVPRVLDGSPHPDAGTANGTQQPARSQMIEHQGASARAISADGRVLVGSDDESGTFVIDTMTGDRLPLMELTLLRRFAKGSSAQVSPDGRYVLLAELRRMSVVDIVDQRHVVTLPRAPSLLAGSGPGGTRLFLIENHSVSSTGLTGAAAEIALREYNPHTGESRELSISFVPHVSGTLSIIAYDQERNALVLCIDRTPDDWVLADPAHVIVVDMNAAEARGSYTVSCTRIVDCSAGLLSVFDSKNALLVCELFTGSVVKQYRLDGAIQGYADCRLGTDRETAVLFDYRNGPQVVHLPTSCRIGPPLPPIWYSDQSSPRVIHQTSGTDVVLYGGLFQSCRVRLPRMVAGSPQQVKLCIELLTGAELTPATAMVALSAEARGRKLSELQESVVTSSE